MCKTYLEPFKNIFKFSFLKINFICGFYCFYYLIVFFLDGFTQKVFHAFLLRGGIQFNFRNSVSSERMGWHQEIVQMSSLLHVCSTLQQCAVILQWVLQLLCQQGRQRSYYQLQIAAGINTNSDVKSTHKFSVLRYWEQKRLMQQ